MKKIGKQTLHFFVGLFLVYAQELQAANDKIKLQTTMSHQSVEVGEPFVVSIEVTTDEPMSVTPPEPPAIPGATFQGKSKGQRINSSTVTNEQGELEFKTVQTQIFNFQYVPEKNGDLVVPSIQVVVGGQPQKSSPSMIKVYAQGAGGSQRNSPQKRRGRPSLDDDDFFGGNPFEQMEKMEEQFNQLLQRRFGAGGAGGFLAVPNFNEKDAFFIVAEVDKTEVFKGEQIVASWYLYTKAGVREIDTLKYPELKGFWKEDIELATLLNFQQDTLNGQPYNKALLASYALFPIDEGKAVIDPYKAKVVIVSALGQALTATKNSESIPVLVKPLPVVGRPADFNGAVGEYQMKAEVEAGTVVAHQPFLLKIRFEGKGNAKQFELPNLNLNPSIEVYDVKNDAKYFKSGMSYKEFQVHLIPRQEGEVVLAPITASYFNPRTQKYETVSTQEVRLKVLPGGSAQTIASSRIGADVAEKTEDVLIPMTEWKPQSVSARWRAGNTGLIVATAAHSSVLLILLIVAAFKLGWFQRDRQTQDWVKARVVKIEAAVQQKQWRQVGVESVNLVYYVLGEISGLGGANVHIDKLLDKCPPSVRRHLSEPLKKSLERFYLLGFGPDSARASDINPKDLLSDVKKLENLLNQALKSQTDQLS